MAAIVIMAKLFIGTNNINIIKVICWLPIQFFTPVRLAYHIWYPFLTLNYNMLILHSFFWKQLTGTWTFTQFSRYLHIRTTGAVQELQKK